MKNYSLTDLEARLSSCSLTPLRRAYYEKVLARLQMLARIPVLSSEDLQDRAQKIRPIYRFNKDFVYWLTPAKGNFPGHFGSAPMPSETNKQDFLGINLKNMQPVCRFRCYSLKPWNPMFFDLAELFRQIPENIDINSWQAGAFELRIKAHTESFYDSFLKIYYTPVVLYRITENMPTPVCNQNPLPPVTDWKPLL